VRANTTDECPQGEEETNGHWPLLFGHELSGRVVDGRNVVSVESVAHAEGVGQNPGADPNRLVRRHGKVPGRGVHEKTPTKHVQEDNEAKHAVQAAPLRGRDNEALMRLRRVGCSSVRVIHAA
jgi:hypothetical protein